MKKKPVPAASSFFRQMIDLVPHFIFAKDAEGRYILANEAVAKAYGIPAEQICQLCDADFAPCPEEAAGFRRDDLEVLRSGKTKYINEVITDCNGNVRDLMTTKVSFDSPETGMGVLGICIDVTERNATLRKIAYLAQHCHLTGLPNRSQLSVFLDKSIQNGEPCALLFVDFDHFKNIHDSLGHLVGEMSFSNSSRLGLRSYATRKTSFAESVEMSSSLCFVIRMPMQPARFRQNSCASWQTGHD